MSNGEEDEAVLEEADASVELVPETLPPDDDAEVSAPEPTLPLGMVDLRGRLADQGFESKIVHIGVAPTDTHYLEIELPAGRSARRVRIAEDAIKLADDVDISDWRSLVRYDGVWSARLGTVEAVVRGDRLGPPPGWLLERLAGSAGTVSAAGREMPEIHLEDPGGRMHVRLGLASSVGMLLLADARRMRRLITLTLTGLAVSTTETAESALETVGDALMVESELVHGQSFSLARLERRELDRGNPLRRRARAPLRFPTNRYPHEPAVLFKTGRDRAAAPLIRYWAFYQVLEYFFPAYSLDAARRRLASLLRDPRFDVHSDDDLTRAVQQLAGSGRGLSNTEREQLSATVEAIVSEDELREFLSNAPALSEQLARRSEVSTELVNVTANAELRRPVSNRIYDIRCRIVHSKSDGAPMGAGLIPGSHHDDLVRAELPLVEFLAQRALIAGAEPLHL